MRKQYHVRPSAAGFRAWDIDRLVAVAKHIEPYLVPVASIRELDEPYWGEPMTCRHVAEHARRHRMLARDLITQVNTGELVYYVTHPDGREERLVHAFQMRCIFRFEAEHLLARAGFTVDQVYSDFDRSPYGSRYPGDLIFIARRQP